MKTPWWHMFFHKYGPWQQGKANLVSQTKTFKDVPIQVTDCVYCKYRKVEKL